MLFDVPKHLEVKCLMSATYSKIIQIKRRGEGRRELEIKPRVAKC